MLIIMLVEKNKEQAQAKFEEENFGNKCSKG